LACEQSKELPIRMPLEANARKSRLQRQNIAFP
jgi:hypothetical protein